MAALSAQPAGATVFGTNGEVVFGEVFPNYRFTINPYGCDLNQIGPVAGVCGGRRT